MLSADYSVLTTRDQHVLILCSLFIIPIKGPFTELPNNRGKSNPVVNDQRLPQSICSGQRSNASSQSSNAEKMCKCTFGIFYLHISKMLKLFEIKGQGKAQYGNFQPQSPINQQETQKLVEQ